ncbi:TCP-1/cpn60 chaperonin family protein [Thermoactinomyces daqus]|uniref:TCP-1/cpn60 chaperonin family protein n=1 Tax=Thermoactinomyces daqus TaxID=1329516 RepID=A0A7W1X9S8_9BACL|nr:TCP-1/cpn60 chaperonin family protein [Thermoactinomyces daqus]MBA4542651.1 TCP-1/cpn60 chaperonin family protein [Thermoactinomyces daqus]
MPDHEYVTVKDETRLSALKSNADAVRSVASAVASTLGPKGLDTMLVDDNHRVIVTNDGVTILDRMEISHPAAKMIVNVAKSQQEEVGDGTTTATLLTAALVEEGVKQVVKGVPVTKVIAGIDRGIRFALRKMKEKARPIYELDDEWLQRIAFTASRENEDITMAVIEAAHLVGREKLLDQNFKLADCIIAHPRVDNSVFSGMVINRQRMNQQMPRKKDHTRVLVLSDALEPDSAEKNGAGEASAKQENVNEAFYVLLEHLIHLQVGLIVTSKGVDPYAEEVLTDAGVIVVTDVSQADLEEVAEHTGARIVTRSGLKKSLEALESTLGSCAGVIDDERLGKLRILGGKGRPMATLIVGAQTEEVVRERERIAKDAASAVQAAVCGGFLPGGGAVELALARDVERFRDMVQGMERFGVSVVAECLERPMSQVVANAGFNPLEKIEAVKALQMKRQSDSLGIDCDRGTIVDMVEMGVVDPLPVKANALKTAGEVAVAILRIHTIVKMKPVPISEQSG